MYCNRLKKIRREDAHKKGYLTSMQKPALKPFSSLNEKFRRSNTVTLKFIITNKDKPYI